MGVTEFFVFWGLYSIVKNMSANSVMLEDTLEEIIISVSVITIFSTALMVYSMLNYIKKRIADYSLFFGSRSPVLPLCSNSTGFESRICIRL